MKIMWLCNTLIGEIAAERGFNLSKPESWIKGIYELVIRDENVSLVYLFPSNEEISFVQDRVVFQSYIKIEEYDMKEEQRQISYFEKCLDKFNPDIIHLFGTELHHSYTMMLACKNKMYIDRVVVSIQGLVSVYARHYYAFMPIKEILFPTIRDIYRSDTYIFQKNQFRMRGKYEKAVISQVFNVIGRTDWDDACVKKMNHHANYFFCNETLRASFYMSEKWSLEKCEKYSIFVSQSNYPIKGFHLLLEVLPDIIRMYPEVHVYTTGDSPLEENFKQKIKQTSYKKYLSRLIRKNHLEGYITFMGYLSEIEMCQRFLKSHVFLSPSSIENSPNSVGEAMILGVPTISSDVGGVKNQLLHNSEGYIYQADAPYMIPYYVGKIFKDDALANKLSKSAISHASRTYDKITNYDQLIHIYNTVLLKSAALTVS